MKLLSRTKHFKSISSKLTPKFLVWWNSSKWSWTSTGLGKHSASDYRTCVLAPLVSKGWGQSCTARTFQSSVVSGSIDAYKDCGCIRAMNPDMGLSSSQSPGITMTLGGNKATHISPLLTSFSSSDVRLSTGHEPHCLPPSHTTPYIWPT